MLVRDIDTDFLFIILFVEIGFLPFMIILWPFETSRIHLNPQWIRIQIWKKLVIFKRIRIPFNDINYISIRKRKLVIKTNKKESIIVRYNNKPDIQLLLDYFKERNISISDIDEN